MGRYDSFYEARDLIAEVLRRDLLGPVEKNEIIGESPLSYYLLGKLHPLESPDDSALEERDGGVDSEVDAYDSPISQSNSSKPSSMGMSFALAPGEQRVTVRIEYALYEGVEEEEAREAGRNFQFQPTESASRERRFFRRSEHSRSIDWEPSSGPSSVLLEGGISANLVQRVKFSDGSIMATVSLSNTNRSSDEKVEQAHMTAFQPAITVFPEASLVSKRPTSCGLRREMQSSENSRCFTAKRTVSHKGTAARSSGTTRRIHRGFGPSSFPATA